MSETNPSDSTTRQYQTFYPPLKDDLLSLGAAARLLPAARGTGRLSPTTLWRWARQGARTPHGQRIRLSVLRVGGHYCVSKAALESFIGQLTEAHSPDATPMPTQLTATQRLRRSERAAEELKRNGI